MKSIVQRRFIGLWPSGGVFPPADQPCLEHGSDRARSRLASNISTHRAKRWMTKASFGWIVLCVLGSTSGCRIPSADWNGIWKANASRSNFQGPVFTISISSDGECRWEAGSTSYAFRCDGKFRPVGQDHVQACVKSSATVLDLTRKKDGVTTNAYRWELSMVMDTWAFFGLYF